MPPDPRRSLPKVDALVRELGPEMDGLPLPVGTDAVREVLEDIRRRARRTGRVPPPGEVAALAREELSRRRRELLTPVVNATGVLVHTNLGRAPLSRAALEAVNRVARGYSNLELELSSGRRGDRYRHVEPLLAVAVGAEAALVVNNNAAAVLLVCAAHAAGREVVVSRGELVEIGGEFRIPEVLAQSGAAMREVGTTNRTHLRDYERAVGPETGVVLKVHPSNYRVVGFTASVATAQLAELCRERKVPLVYDVGSGLLEDDLGAEPGVSEALRDGASLVCFSGDKLLGGPQAGVVCGSARLVDALRTHPLLRALRPDKMTLAALGATVTAHLQGDRDDIPLWRMLNLSTATLARRCRRVARDAAAAGYTADVAESESVAGGGSMPGEGIPTVVVRLRRPSMSATRLASSLRDHDPPVIARVESGAVVVDLRTVLPAQDRVVSEALSAAAQSSV